MTPFDPVQVRRYYDRHTRAFITFGQGGQLGTIHRAVWGPGVTTKEDACRYVDDQIAATVRALVTTTAKADPSRLPFIVDLGCGVGATLCHLAERATIQGLGITLSPVQARLATQRVRAAGLADRVRCVEGDYCRLPLEDGTTDLAYAIESFVHGPDPTGFFAESARVIRPGGLLIICDDVRRPTTDRRAASTIEQFCRGWHVNTLVEPTLLHRLATAAGFRHEATHDLSPYLRLNRPRDRMLAVVVGALGWAPPLARHFDHLVGGNALRTCLRRKWVGYELARFRRLG